MHCKFIYQVEVFSRFGRIWTNMKVPGYQWIGFPRTFWVCHFVHAFSLLTLAWSVTPQFIVLHNCSVLNMHVWSPMMSVGIMLDCGDFCTQLTTLKSTHNTQPGKFCCHLVLSSCSCAGGELCGVASLPKSNGETQVFDGHRWNIYVIFWCKNRWKHFVNVFYYKG